MGRYTPRAGDTAECLDCGSIVADRRIHDRFHAISNSHARAIAVLVTSHLNERTHGRWDVYDKARATRNDDNWSAEAFAEVTGTPAPSEQMRGNPAAWVRGEVIDAAKAHAWDHPPRPDCSEWCCTPVGHRG